MVENHLMLHHSRQNVPDKSLENRSIDSSGQAIFVRKNLVKHECWIYQGDEKNVLNSDQIIERELEALALLGQLLEQRNCVAIS